MFLAPPKSFVRRGFKRIFGVLDSIGHTGVFRDVLPFLSCPAFRGDGCCRHAGSYVAVGKCSVECFGGRSTGVDSSWIRFFLSFMDGADDFLFVLAAAYMVSVVAVKKI